MSTIIATNKSWAACSYINYFGEKIPIEPSQGTIKVEALTHIFEIPNNLTNITINENTYSLDSNQFSFVISKNDTIEWRCNQEPTPEFDDLVTLALPLWENYKISGKPYNGK